MKRYRQALSGSILLALSACAAQPTPYDYSALRAANPRSILVVPVVNKTTQVEAADTFLATLASPIAERGYYVFPLNMVKHTMEDDGLADADMVAGAPAQRLASLFGADAVLYAEINHWESKYIVLSTSTEVSVHYVLKSGHDGSILWDSNVTTVYSPHSSGGNPIADLIADAIIAAIERGHPSYIPLANQANALAFYDPNKGLLAGPYGTK
jgi:hypothetical protein